MQNLVIDDCSDSSRDALASDDAEGTPSFELGRRLAVVEAGAQELIDLEERGGARIELVAHLERISYAAHVGRILIMNPPSLEPGPCLVDFGRDALRSVESMLDSLRCARRDLNEPNGLEELLLSRARCFAEIVRAPIRETTDLDRVNDLMALREAFWMLGRHAVRAAPFADELEAR